MRIGEPTRVAVKGTDLVLLVRIKWGDYKRTLREVTNKTEVEALPAVDALLRSAIVGVSGLVGKDDQPLEWTPDLLDELAPSLVLSMFESLAELGEAGSGDPLPATASAETSGG